MTTDRQLDLSRSSGRNFVAVFFDDGNTSTVPRKLVSRDLELERQCQVDWKNGSDIEKYPGLIIGFGETKTLAAAERPHLWGFG